MFPGDVAFSPERCRLRLPDGSERTDRIRIRNFGAAVRDFRS